MSCCDKASDHWLLSTLMRKRNSLPLDDDVVLLIFALCPDFETLDAVTLVCKSLRAVFTGQSDSITTAVARTFIGPALPRALERLRYTPSDEAQDEVADEAASPAPGDIDSGRTVVAAAEKAGLRRNAAIVQGPEVTHQCPGAAGGLPLPACHFTACAYEEADVNLIGDDSPAFQKICAQRLAVLSKYPTDDLRETHALVLFLRQVVDWVLQDEANRDHEDANQTYDICIAAGPELVLETHEARSMDPMDEKCPLYDSDSDIPLFAGFFTDPLALIWESRSVSPPAEGSANLSSILEEVRGIRDTCKQCDKTETRRLWTPATWEHFNLNPPSLLPGKLHSNHLETGPMNAFLGTPEEFPEAISALIEEVFLQVERQPGFGEWEEDDALCEGCLQKILTAHLHLWLLAKKLDGFRQKIAGTL
ncbi:hypothetical protein DFH09DRAFT_1274433 [Mycena vulgaris]|nr:hypothetical protein DFH09DRAFT_1274433 [Mycena vulgaris]